MKNSSERRELILKGNLWKAVTLLAVPVAINDLVRSMYNLIDTLFVASIGSMEVAAITFVGPINMLVRTISVGLAIGGTNLIAREIGRGDYEKAKNVSMQLLAIATFFGLAIMMLAFSFSTEILRAASATDSILGTADTYFKLTALSAPFIFINSAYISIKRADGDTLKTMRINLMAMGIKVVVSYILIINLHMGISGLGISTIVGTMFVSCYAFYDLFIRRGMMRLSLKYMQFTKKVLGALFVIGLPIIIEKSSISFSFIILNKYVIDYGEKVLAGYGIANRVNSLFFATVTGFATGLSPIVSQNLAALQADRARNAIKKTFIIAVGVAVVVASFVIPLRYVIAGVFSSGDQEVLTHTVNAMSVYTITIIPWAVFQVANGVFQGTGHTKYNMIISIMRIYAFRLPLVIGFSMYTNFAEYSIWYAMLISNVLTGVFALILYLKNSKELKLIGEG